MSVSKLGSWGAVCALLLTGLFVSGCQSGNSAGQFAEVPGVTTPSTANSVRNPVAAPGGTNGGSAELIHVGDALVIVFSDLPQPMPPFEVPVRDDGTITLLLNKTFQAAGKTLVGADNEDQFFL